MEFETEATEGVGTRWKQTRTVFGREHAQTMEVGAWRPAELLVLTAREAGAKYESRYVFLLDGQAQHGPMLLRPSRHEHLGIEGGGGGAGEGEARVAVKESPRQHR